MLTWTTRNADPSAGIIARIEDEQPLVVLDRAVLDDAQDVVALVREHRHVVVWSGNSHGGSFERDPRIWSPQVRARLVERCASLQDQLRDTPNRVIVRSHCRHVVSDLPACRWFCEEIRSENVGLCVDVSSIFERSMMDRVEDHMCRLLGEVTCVDLVLVREPLVDPGAPGDALPVGVPLGTTGAGLAHIGRLLEELHARGADIVLDGDNATPQSQLDALARACPGTP